MNNNSKGNGYPENVFFCLTGLAFTIFWTLSAMKNGAPVFFLIPGVFGILIMAIGFVNSIKAYAERRRGKIHDMSGGSYPDEKWEKVYSGPDKGVYKKGGMTFTSYGPPGAGIITGAFFIFMILRNIIMEFRGNGTSSSPFMLIIILIMMVAGLLVNISRFADRKQDKQNMIDRMRQEEDMRLQRRNSTSMRYFTEKDWENRTFENGQITFCCPYCDGRLENNYEFCPHCGNKLHK